MTTTTLPAFRMIPADIDSPAGWSPVGYDLRATEGTGAILARVRFGGPTTTGAMPDEVQAVKRLIASAPELLTALENVLVWLPTGYETGVVCGEYAHLLGCRKSIETLLASIRS